MLIISELLVDPVAASDNFGEWIEVANPGPAPVDLGGWIIADLGRDHFTVPGQLIIAPGEYAVLGRKADMTMNGAVVIDVEYSGISLANDDDELILLRPDGSVADSVAWGPGMPLAVNAGASWQRVRPEPGAPWIQSTVPWPGSAGDHGSPGLGYVAMAIATASPIPPTPTLIMPPTVAPSPIPPTATLAPTPLPRLWISEVMADPAAVDDRDGEWIEVYNASDFTANLNGWVLSDLGGDLHVITDNVLVVPGGNQVIGRNQNANSNGGVTIAYVYTSGISLANGEDELILRAPDGSEQDRVVWSAAPTGASLARIGFSCRHLGPWLATLARLSRRPGQPERTQRRPAADHGAYTGTRHAHTGYAHTGYAHTGYAHIGADGIPTRLAAHGRAAAPGTHQRTHGRSIRERGQRRRVDRTAQSSRFPGQLARLAPARHGG